MTRWLLALGFLVVPLGARAQQPHKPVPPNFAALVGVVNDSIHGGPLVGAVVTIIGTTRRSTTDINGIFQIDSIPPGAQRIEVTHPLLDSLGMTVVSDPLALQAGILQQLGVHTPSFEEVRAKSCARGGVATGTSILVGRVTMADTDVPAAGASLSLVYKDLSQKDKETIEHVRTGRVTAIGTFAICGLPGTITGTLQASLSGVTSPDVPIKLNDESLAMAMLTLSGSGAGRAAIHGIVTSKVGTPIGGVQVTLVGTTTVVVTGDNGKFVLDGLPSGTHELVARKIGFAKTSQMVQLSQRAPSDVKVMIEEAQVLSTVHVVGKMDAALASTGFLARKQLGAGWYLTPEQIEAKNPHAMSDLFLTAQGIRTNGPPGLRSIASNSSAGSTDGCVNIFIDHGRFDQMQAGDLDDAVPVGDLGAIEFYPRPSAVPSEFDVVGKACATLVVWTKTRLLSGKSAP